MERRIQLSSRRDTEADELRRELEEARKAERMAKMQLQEAKGPMSPSNMANSTNSSGIGVIVRTMCSLKN